MIVLLLEIIAGAIISIITTLLKVFTYVLPSDVNNAMTWFIAKSMALQGVFPIDTLLTALMVVMIVVGISWTFKLLIFGLNLIPGIKAVIPKRGGNEKEK